MKTPIEVEIYGQTFTVASEDEEKYVRSLAAYVDRCMRQVGESTKTAAPIRVAIMAALGIADEYHKAMRREAEVQREANRLASEMLARIEQSERADEVAISERVIRVFSDGVFSSNTPTPTNNDSDKKKESLSIP